jgi:RecB family exonuclease
MNVSFDQLEALLRREAEASDTLAITKVLGAETELKGSIALEPPMRVTGVVDRIDQGAGLAVVVDYKSGRPIERRELETGKRVQLQLYSYLASIRTGASRMVARYAWVRPPKKEWDLDSARPEDASLIQAVVGTAAAVRANVEHGNFRVAPSVQPCPSYCAMIRVCRVNEYTRWKSWS